MPNSALRPKILICLCLAGLTLGWLGSEALRLSGGDGATRAVNMGALALGGAAFLMGCVFLVRYFRAHGEAEKAAADAENPRGRARVPGARPAENGGDEDRSAPAGALRATLRCLDRPALVVGERGRVLYANPAAAACFDPLGRPGDALADLVDPTDWRQAVMKARNDGAPVGVLLRRRDGLGDLSARVADLGFQAGATAVFDAPPAPPPAPPARPGGRWGVALDPAQPLAPLPITALTVTMRDGRAAEIATVRLTGGRVFPTLSLDFVLARPDLGRPGRLFAEIWPTLAQTIAGSVTTAENAAATWEALRAELTAAGFAAVEPPPLIDLSALAAKYDPTWAEWDLDRLAAALNVVESDPARRLARATARLALGPSGDGLGGVGEFLLKPAAPLSLSPPGPFQEPPPEPAREPPSAPRPDSLPEPLPEPFADPLSDAPDDPTTPIATPGPSELRADALKPAEGAPLAGGETQI